MGEGDRSRREDGAGGSTQAQGGVANATVSSVEPSLSVKRSTVRSSASSCGGIRGRARPACCTNAGAQPVVFGTMRSSCRISAAGAIPGAARCQASSANTSPGARVVTGAPWKSFGFRVTR